MYAVPYPTTTEHWSLLNMSLWELCKAAKHDVVVTGAWRDKQTQGEVIMVQRNPAILPSLKKVLLVTERPFISSPYSRENKSQGYSNREDKKLEGIVTEFWFSQRISVAFYTVSNPGALQVIAKKVSHPLLSFLLTPHHHLCIMSPSPCEIK